MADELTAVEQMQADIAAGVEAVARAIGERDAARAELETAKTEAAAALEAVKGELAQICEKIKALEGEKAALAEAKTKAEGDAQAALELAGKAEAQTKLLEGVIARDPDALRMVKISGTGALKNLDGQANAAGAKAEGSALAEWKAALDRAGGDYVKARKDNPELFAKLVPGAKG